MAQNFKVTITLPSVRFRSGSIAIFFFWAIFAQAHCNIRHVLTSYCGIIFLVKISFSLSCLIKPSSSSTMSLIFIFNTSNAEYFLDLYLLGSLMIMWICSLLTSSISIFFSSLVMLPILFPHKTLHNQMKQGFR